LNENFGVGDILLARFFSGIGLVGLIDGNGKGKAGLGAGPTFKILLAGESLKKITSLISLTSSNFLFFLPH